MVNNTKDPRKMYYSKKYPKQQETSPQLQSLMDPLPDCGEESYVGTGKLIGRNALITGGDSGIGRAAAIAYAREGANVAIQFIKGEEKDANEVKELIEKEGVKALLLPLDFRKEGNAAKAVQETVKAFGALDLLVLNAAQQYAVEKLADLSMKQVKDTFAVKIFSVYEAVKEAEEHLKPGSTIITTTSVQSADPSTYFLDYAATNAAMDNITVNLAEYFAPKGVRVNGVAPGPIWTPLQLDGGRPGGKVSNFGANSLLKRAGQPVELAPIYVFLASKESSYVTGQIYGVTGGTTINL